MKRLAITLTTVVLLLNAFTATADSTRGTIRWSTNLNVITYLITGIVVDYVIHDSGIITQ